MDSKDSSPVPPRPPLTGRLALLVSILLPIAAIVAVAVVTASFAPPLGPQLGRESRAALAIRDDVTPFQKWGTRTFTYGQLAANYDRVDYFTQGFDDPKSVEFVAALEAALRGYDVVDVFLLAHSNSYVAWLNSIAPELRRKIRLVYNTGCWGGGQGQSWIEAGADAYVGHVGRSESPIFYVYFLRHWIRGVTIDKAVRESNDATYDVLALTGGLLYRGRPLEDAWQATQAVVFGDCQVNITTGAPQ